ncbi:hypothetical protein HDU87_007348 [Geranomyces variabilis]|uniref:Uncharacterized protein n=1 Tax=Geranomyces variabilis TaxID=109894 RepID=A0AAD5TGP0_9FUNG|nr:hypothetical protein HDU87_007348 [Geranomyces variabilis]
MTSGPTSAALHRRRRSRSVSPPPLEPVDDDADSLPSNAPPTSPVDSDIGEQQQQKRHSGSGTSTAKKTLAAASPTTPTTLSASRPTPPPISTSTVSASAAATTTSPRSASDSNTSAASSASVLSTAAAAAEPPTISSPRPATATSATTKRRKRQYYLRITISAAKRGALPGYEGDRRVEWAVSDDAASLTESAERTRDALGTLKEFWDDVAPEELGFDEFAWCVFGEEFAPDAATASGTGSPASEVDVTASMAARLAGNTMALSAFLADVRDWDAFRLLIRRRAGRLPVSLAARGHERRQRAREASSSSDGGNVVGAATSATGLRDEAVRMLASEAFFYVLAEKEAEWDAQRAQLETALAAAERKVQRIVHSVTGALGGAIGEIPLHRTAQRTDSVVRRSLESIRVANNITSSGQGPTTSATTLGSSRRAAVGGTTVRNVSLDGGSRPVRRATSHNQHQQHHNNRLNKKVSFDLDTLRREDVKDSLLSRITTTGSASTDIMGVPALSISAPARAPNPSAHAPPSPAPTLVTPRLATSTVVASAVHSRRRDSDISITKTDSPTTAPADSAWRDLDTTTSSPPHSASSSSSSGRRRGRVGDSDDSAEDTMDSSGGTDSEHGDVDDDRFDDEHDFEDTRKTKRHSDDSATRGRRRHDDGSGRGRRAGHGYSSSSSSTSSATATVGGGGGGGGGGGAGGLYRFDNTAFVPTSDLSPTVTPRTSDDGATAAATTATTTPSPPSTKRHSKCLDFARPRRSAEVRREEQAAAAAAARTAAGGTSPPVAKEANAVRKLGRYLRSKVSRDSFR